MEGGDGGLRLSLVQGRIGSRRVVCRFWTFRESVALFHSAELFLRFARFCGEGRGLFELNVDFSARGFSKNLHLVFAARAKQSFSRFALPPSLSPIPLSLKQSEGSGMWWWLFEREGPVFAKFVAVTCEQHARLPGSVIGTCHGISKV